MEPKDDINKLNITAGINNNQLQADAKRLKDVLKSIGDSVEAEAARIDNAFNRAFEGISKYGMSSQLGLHNAIRDIAGDIKGIDFSKFNFKEVKLPDTPQISKEELEKYTLEYGDFEQKCAAITEKYKGIIAKAPHLAAGAKQKYDEEIAALREKYGMAANTIQALFKTAGDKSVSELRKIANKAGELYQELNKGKFDVKFGISEKAFDAVKNETGGYSKEFGEKYKVTEKQFNAVTAVKDEKPEYKDNFNKDFGISEKSFNILKESPELMNKFLEAIKKTHKEAGKLDNGFKKVADGFKDAFKSGGDAEKRREGLKTLATGLGEISTLSKSVGSDVSSVFEAFGNTKAASKVKGIADVIGGVATAGQGVAKMMSGDIMGGIKDTISGIAQTITSITKMHDQAKEERIKELQKEYDKLEREISSVERNVSKIKKQESKAHGSNKSDLIGKENEQLENELKMREEQKRIINEQMENEKGKKKTDDGKMENWKKALEAEEKATDDLKEKINDNKDAMVDALFGSNIQTAIDNFADAYAKAWGAGTDRAKDMKKVVKDLMKSYVMEMIKADAGLEDTIKKIRAKIDEYLQDGILDATEQDVLDGIISDATNDLDYKFSGLMNLFKDDATREASQKGFAAMSQDSADELNGRFTAFTALTYEINENTKILVANSGQMLLRLAGIESNTESCRRLDGMDTDLKSIRYTLSDIQLKGLKVI